MQQNDTKTNLLPQTKNNIKFVKMHGLGNDFVIIDKKDLPQNCNIKQLSKIVSNRHIGIGCDQFIVYDHCQDYYEMQIYNQDGSEAKACGNASRCLAKLLHEKFGKKNITIKTISRTYNAGISDYVYDTQTQYMVNMGAVSFAESWMPSEQKLWEFAVNYAIQPKEMICADVGNPHLIIFSPLSHEDKEIIGSKLQNSELFPNGVNVNFASVTDKIYLEVFERGTGFTLACGSGACASFAAASRLGFVENYANVVFKLGELKMSFDEYKSVVMTGPATLVAAGDFVL